MALDDPLDEHEQSERVLAWLRENGVALVGGLVLGLAAIAGWKWWEHQRQGQALAEADRYQTVLTAIEANDAGAASLVAGLENGVYADLAALELASRQVDAGATAEALKTLQSIASDDPALQDIVNQRLARLLLDTGKAEDAMRLLDGADSAIAAEVRGDAQYALGDKEKARAAYSEALTRMDVASPRRKLLELKFIEVGGEPADPEAQS